MDTVRTSKIFSDSALTVMAVESLHSNSGKTKASCHVFGKVEALAVIIRSPAGTYALDMEAQPVELNLLRQNLPELATLIDQWSST